LQSQNKSERTIETYLAAVVQFCSFLDDEGHSTDVSAIAREQVEAYISWLLRRSSEGTASVRYRALQQFFRWLVDEREIDESPMARTKAPTVHPKPTLVFDGGDVEKLLRSCAGGDFDDRRDTALIRLLADSGMRRAELTNLSVEDVSLTEREVWVLGKGGKHRLCYFGTDTALALDRYLRVREDHPYADSADLWLGRAGPMTGNGIGQMLRRRGRDAGVSDVHAHRFRHTMAHEWQMEGGNEGALMVVAGWSSRSMLDRYGKSAAQKRAKVEFGRVRQSGRRR
jgi:site-specific recombinase XerD